jgi:hypothetical protein
VREHLAEPVQPGQRAHPKAAERREEHTSPALLSRLQRTAGNRAVQRLLAVGRIGGTETPDGPVVEDGAEPSPGQMRRTPFLAALRSELEGVVAGADPLAQADARARLPAAFADLAAQDAAGITRSLRENLPGVEGTDAARFITAAGAAARARIGGAAVAAPTGGVVGRVLSAVGGLVSALFKARDGAATPADARVVRGTLGTGQPLDAGIRLPVERAYGRDFSDVRVHTDAAAGALSDRMGARAFTVNADIAFSPGEYQPDSMAGSALIAHELAHVGQLDGDGSSSVAALEEDADRAAVGAVVSRWSDHDGSGLDAFMPRLRSGLRLQRCAGAQARPAAAPQSCAALTPDQWGAAVEAARALSGTARGSAMTQLAQQAVCELGIGVRQAGTAHADAVHPDDYAETPVLNFDAGLNDKTRWRTSPDRDPRPMGSNPGYNFRAGARRFAIIGPNALNPNTWLTTRQYAQHELSLVAMPQGGRTNDDLELEQWTQDFRSYFHQYALLPIPQRPTWTPLSTYYDRAAADRRRQTVTTLVGYFNNPPGEDPERVRRAMRSWLSRRSTTLAGDLTAALPAAP